MQKMRMIHKDIKNIAYSNLGDKANLYLNISQQISPHIFEYLLNITVLSCLLLNR